MFKHMDKSQIAKISEGSIVFWLSTYCDPECGPSEDDLYVTSGRVESIGNVSNGIIKVYDFENDCSKDIQVSWILDMPDDIENPEELFPDFEEK